MSEPDGLFQVLLTQSAEQDLESIFDYIAELDSVLSAHHVLDELMGVVQSLARYPDRGSHPRELLELGIKTYRQTHFKPYRVIYRVAGSRVIIHLIADGRRHMSSLLQQRLLGQ